MDHERSMTAASDSQPSERTVVPEQIRSPRCVVVIPAYNEARTIGPLLDRVLGQLQTVIVVNDDSIDDTAAIAADKPVRLINQPWNSGKGHALATGFRQALESGAELVITMDGDGQHDPLDLPKFLAAAARCPHDLIIGARILDRDQAPWARRFANRFADFWISWASGQALADSQCGYRCVPAALLKRIRISDTRSHGFVFESEFVIEACRLGTRVTFVPIRSCYPPDRRPSHFRPVTDIARITAMVAWKLLSRGLYLRGLFGSLNSSPRLLRD
jgi:glycosyltransferase involved in cell wall biosynthesis